ncbi:hypothetical protein HHI36_000899, partial [Cryptolaemus montrouzieri]
MEIGKQYKSIFKQLEKSCGLSVRVESLKTRTEVLSDACNVEKTNAEYEKSKTIFLNGPPGKMVKENSKKKVRLEPRNLISLLKTTEEKMKKKNSQEGEPAIILGLMVIAFNENATTAQNEAFQEEHQ